MCRSRLWLLYWVSTAIRAVAAVDQVGQSEVDQAVVAGKRDGGFGPVGGERGQPLPLTPGKDDGKDPLASLSLSNRQWSPRPFSYRTTRLVFWG